VIQRRATISLLLAGALSSACGTGAPPRKPELPQSISPGWILKGFNRAAPPAGLPASATPECWRADYVSKGAAQVWVCGYIEGSSAFDALQRARAEADTVKFQEGRYLAIVKWNGVSRDEIRLLIRGVQKALKGN
jgi:hypothetical protein